jgi:hypothetical protein
MRLNASQLRLSALAGLVDPLDANMCVLAAGGRVRPTHSPRICYWRPRATTARKECLDSLRTPSSPKRSPQRVGLRLLEGSSNRGFELV